MTNFAPLPLQPHDEEGPVFAEPWQAEAFALAVQLSEGGLFTWKEWTETIGDEMQKARDGGDPDLGDTYYDHWLRALERLAREKGATDANAMAERKDAWRRAYLNTPHGQPVHLSASQ
jgi:nitrile hydratase accessory protein